MLLCSLLCVTSPVTALGAELVKQAAYENVAGEVERIRKVYNQTNSGSYIQRGTQTIWQGDGWEEVLKTVVSNGNPYLDPLMKAYGYGTYNVEYYYGNSDCGYTTRDPVFIFAVIDQKEYRYYFSGNSMIRRIGPEGKVSNNPETNDFLNHLYQIGCLYSKTLDNLEKGQDLRNTNIVALEHYDTGSSMILNGRVLELDGKGGIYVVDENTQVTAMIRSEKTWRSGDTAYTWFCRYFQTPPEEGGYMRSLDCYEVITTGGHVDWIDGVYATH